MQNFKVGIAIITYNQEKYIAQSIESVLLQKTNFAYKIVIGEDYSKDKTLAICQDYAKRFADKIFLIPPRGKNVHASTNIRDCFDACRDCEYIILLEGDDYWTDPLKLQKQVDFLDKNPDFSMCFHNAEVFFDQGEQANYNLNDGIEKDTFVLDDLIAETEVWFIATASMLFRSKAIVPLPEWFLKSKSGDIPLQILASKHGKFKYLNEVMSVYRKHAGGLSLTDHEDDANFLENRIFMYQMINKETNGHYRTKLDKNIARYYRMMLESKQFRGNYWKQMPCAFTYLKLAKPSNEIKIDIYKQYIIPKSAIILSRKVKTLLGIIPK